MTKREVLIETILPDSNPVRIAEDVTGGKRLFLEGIAIQGEKKNHNGRIYPRPEIERAVNKMSETIGRVGPIIGECDHPEGLTVSLKNASHIIERTWMDGDDGHSRFAVLEHGYGQTIRDLVKIGAKLGVSSRGSGNVDRNGRVSDFDIVTIDIVANPSAHDAYPTPILESLGNTTQGRKVLDLAESVRNDPKAQRYFQKEILTFLNKITGN